MRSEYVIILKIVGNHPKKLHAPSPIGIAPSGSYRLTGYAKYDHSDYLIADFDSVAAARDEALARAAKPNGTPEGFSDDYFIYDERGNCLLKVSSSASGPIESWTEVAGTAESEVSPATTADTSDAIALHWSASVVLLSLACAMAGWICALGPSHGRLQGDAGAMAATLIVLLGIDPFFMRRNHYFTPGGLVIVAGVGLAIAALSWIFRFNTIVFVWIGMTWALLSVARETSRGKTITHQVKLEKATHSNPPTGQSERMLMAYDFLALLLVGFLLLVAWNAVAADLPLPPRKPVATADELHDLMLDSIIDHNPRPPYLTSNQILEHCRLYRGEERYGWCMERADNVRLAEADFPAALRGYVANTESLQRGFVVFFADLALRQRYESDQVTPTEKRFLELVDKLMKGYYEAYDCGKKYDCRFVVRFDPVSHELLGVEFANLGNGL